METVAESTVGQSAADVKELLVETIGLVCQLAGIPLTTSLDQDRIHLSIDVIGLVCLSFPNGRQVEVGITDGCQSWDIYDKCPGSCVTFVMSPRQAMKYIIGLLMAC